MYKTLLKSYEDFQSLINENTGQLGYYGYTTTMLDTDDDSRPRQYPCVAIWEIQEYSDGPAHLHAEFVYLDDFE